jgi:catechol 2,3-dioxygenase-like lactoylglutathione lyase family enzyme
MSLINPTGLHHLRITVTDLARSRAFYQDVDIPQKCGGMDYEE